MNFPFPKAVPLCRLIDRRGRRSPLVPLGKMAALTAMCPFRTYVKHSCWGGKTTQEVLRFGINSVWMLVKFVKTDYIDNETFS